MSAANQVSQLSIRGAASEQSVPPQLRRQARTGVGTPSMAYLSAQVAVADTKKEEQGAILTARTPLSNT